MRQDFDTVEAQFVLALGPELSRLASPHGFAGRRLLLKEVDCFQGRVDFLQAHFPSSRSQAGTPGLGTLLAKPSVAKILAQLCPRAPRTEQHIGRATGLSGRTLRRRLDDLEGVGLAARSGTAWVLGRKRRLPSVEIWAIEAKLEKWKRALYQAAQYRGFSHRSLVVMPSTRASAAIRNIAAFQTLGIGLAVFDPSNGVEIVSMPRRCAPRSKSLHFVALGRILSAMESQAN